MELVGSAGLRRAVCTYRNVRLLFTNERLGKQHWVSWRPHCWRVCLFRFQRPHLTLPSQFKGRDHRRDRDGTKRSRLVPVSELGIEIGP